MSIFSRTCAAALLFLSLAFAGDPPQPCAKSGAAHIIGVRGASQGPPVPYGGLTTMIVGMKEKIPGSTNSSVQYPKHQQGGTPVGVEVLRKQLKDHVAQCPDTPIIMAGYSQGAVIIMNLICGGDGPGVPNIIPGLPDIDLGGDSQPLSTKYLKQIVAVNIYGDESRTPDQPYDRGTCESYGIALRTNADQCLPYADVIRSWCNSNDALCCLGGTSKKAHGDYPEDYDKAAIAFAVKQVKNYVPPE